MNFGYYLHFFPEEQQLTPEKVSLVTSILGGGGNSIPCWTRVLQHISKGGCKELLLG